MNKHISIKLLLILQNISDGYVEFILRNMFDNVEYKKIKNELIKMKILYYETNRYTTNIGYNDSKILIINGYYLKQNIRKMKINKYIY